MELYEFRFVFKADGRLTTADCRAEEKLHVNRNDHPDYSHHRFARWLQRHRRRTLLRHRLLRRRRPWPHYRDPVDFAAAWKTLTAIRHSGARVFARTRNPDARCLVLDSGSAPKGRILE